MAAKEVWKSIPGYKGRYEASNLGRIKSLDRTLTDGRSWKGRILKKTIQHNGYEVVTLGMEPNKRVHILVTVTFFGLRPYGSDIRHLDGNKQNNKLTNLCYGTRAENEHDKINHGRSNRAEDRKRVNDSKKSFGPGSVRAGTGR